MEFSNLKLEKKAYRNSTYPSPSFDNSQYFADLVSTVAFLMLRVESLSFTCKKKNVWHDLHFKLFFQFWNNGFCDQFEKFDLTETLEGKEMTLTSVNYETWEEGRLLSLGGLLHIGSKVKIKQISLQTLPYWSYCYL